MSNYLLSITYFTRISLAEMSSYRLCNTQSVVETPSYEYQVYNTLITHVLVETPIYVLYNTLELVKMLNYQVTFTKNK